METKKQKQHDRAEAGAKGDITRRDVHRGFLTLGLVMEIIAIFMASATVRYACVAINRGEFVQDAIEIEFFNIPAKGFSTHSESSSLGEEEFGRPSLRGDNFLDIEPIYLHNAR